MRFCVWGENTVRAQMPCRRRSHGLMSAIHAPRRVRRELPALLLGLLLGLAARLLVRRAPLVPAALLPVALVVPLPPRPPPALLLVLLPVAAPTTWGKMAGPAGGRGENMLLPAAPFPDFWGGRRKGNCAQEEAGPGIISALMP